MYSSSLTLWRSLLGSLNALLFIHFSSMLSENFSPIKAPLGGVLFAASYGLRPLALMVISYLEQQRGPSWVVQLCCVVGGLMSVLIALCPPYAVWGSVTLMILLTARSLQGFCASCEHMAAKIYLSYLPPSTNYQAGLLNVAVSVGGIVVLPTAWLIMTYGGQDAWRYIFFVVGILPLVLNGLWLKSPQNHKDLSLKDISCTNNAPSPHLSFSKTASLQHFRWTTVLAYLGFSLWTPIMFLIIFIYGSQYIQKTYGLSACDMLLHDAAITVLYAAMAWAWAYVARYRSAEKVVTVMLSFVAVLTPIALLVFYYPVPYAAALIIQGVINGCVAPDVASNSLMRLFPRVSRFRTILILQNGVRAPFVALFSACIIPQIAEHVGAKGLGLIVMIVTGMCTLSIRYMAQQTCAPTEF